MGITPHVWMKYDRTGKPTHVVIGLREFWGVERPDYNPLHHLTPDEARYIAHECWKYAEMIDGKQDRESKMKAVRENTAEIAAAAKKEAEQ